MTDRREYMREYMHEYYQRHKAERAKYLREYRALRKERETAEARRKRKLEYGREYSRQYRKSHRDEINAGKRHWRAMRKLGGDARAGDVVPTDAIMRAKVKPKGVSDVRWRIELSRRRMAAKEKAGGGIGNLSTLPHPDRLW